MFLTIFSRVGARKAHANSSGVYTRFPRAKREYENSTMYEISEFLGQRHKLLKFHWAVCAMLLLIEELNEDK